MRAEIMSDVTRAPRTSSKALVSFLWGLLSLVLFLVAGIPAVLLGLHSLREINRSDGALRGRPFAVAGMVLGGLGTLVTLVGIVVLIAFHVRQPSERTVCQN